MALWGTIETNRTGGAHGGQAIAITFVFIAYVLQPITEGAFNRIRASYAWRNIENGESVEVTQYPIVAEILRGRGKWDVARIAAVLLAVFSLASWGLELRLGLVDDDRGTVDKMDRPPPVVLRDGNKNEWEVLGGFKTFEAKGSMGNFAVPKGADDAKEAGNATSRYKIEGIDRVFVGSTKTAWWSTDALTASSHLSYDEQRDGSAVLEILDCDNPDKGFVYLEDNIESWGNFTMCGNGPSVLSNSNNASAPTIIMWNANNREVHLIVEEDSNYPGFMYSIWRPENTTVTPTTQIVAVDYVFHIVSTSRLAEAIITGIVNGMETGGECVDLLWQYSDEWTDYENDSRIQNETRASPFGEHPGNSNVQKLSDVEPIERGIRLGELAATCFVFLVFLSVVGIGWSFCLHSRIGMDIFDRDELIRAVCLPGGLNADGRSPQPSAARMFVRKDEAGTIDVIISDTGESEGQCWKHLCRRPHPVAHDEPAAAAVVNDNGPGAVRAGSRQVRLEGWRMGMGRNDFARGFGPRSVSLTSSPVHSPVVTPTNTSPAHDRTIEISRQQFLAQGRLELGASFSTHTNSSQESGSFHFINPSVQVAPLASGSPQTNASTPGDSAPHEASSIQTHVDQHGLPRPAPTNGSFSTKGAAVAVPRAIPGSGSSPAKGDVPKGSSVPGWSPPNGSVANRFVNDSPRPVPRRRAAVVTHVVNISPRSSLAAPPAHHTRGSPVPTPYRREVIPGPRGSTIPTPRGLATPGIHGPRGESANHIGESPVRGGSSMPDDSPPTRQLPPGMDTFGPAEFNSLTRTQRDSGSCDSGEDP